MLTGKQFFPDVISGPFHHGLVIVFTAAAIMSFIGAMVSLLRGKQFYYEEPGSPQAAPAPVAVPAMNGNGAAPDGHQAARTGTAPGPNGNGAAPDGHQAAPNGSGAAPNGNGAAPDGHQAEAKARHGASRVPGAPGAAGDAASPPSHGRRG